MEGVWFQSIPKPLVTPLHTSTLSLLALVLYDLGGGSMCFGGHALVCGLHQVLRILTPMLARGLMDPGSPWVSGSAAADVTSDAHRAFSRKLAARSSVRRLTLPSPAPGEFVPNGE